MIAIQKFNPIKTKLESVSLTNSQIIAHPMIIPWLKGAHSEMEGYDVHLVALRMNKIASQRIRSSATYPNQKNTAA